MSWTVTLASQASRALAGFSETTRRDLLSRLNGDLTRNPFAGRLGTAIFSKYRLYEMNFREDNCIYRVVFFYTVDEEKQLVGVLQCKLSMTQPTIRRGR